MVLLVLAVLWGIVLIPPALRARAETRRERSVGAFRRRLERLAPSPDDHASGAPGRHVAVLGSPKVVALPVAASVFALPAATAEPAAYQDPSLAPIPPSRAAILRRRRRVLTGIFTAMIVTLAVGFLPGWRWVLVVHAALCIACAAYMAGLRRLRRIALERVEKVRYLPVAEPAASPALVVELPAEAEAADGRRRRSASS